MGDVSEIQQAKAWLYETLHANADIQDLVGERIYADYAPDTPEARTYPYILFNYMAGADGPTFGSRAFTEAPFQVRVVCEDRPTDDIRLLDKRIDDVLEYARNEQSGDYSYTARREQPVDRTETDPKTGKRYHNLGGLYRVWRH